MDTPLTLFTWRDVPGFTEADQWMVADALAELAGLAPCVVGAGVSSLEWARAQAVLRRALTRWKEVGSGSRSSTTHQAGPFSHTDSVDLYGSRDIFSVREEAKLRSLCSSASPRARMGWLA